MSTSPARQARGSGGKGRPGSTAHQKSATDKKWRPGSTLGRANVKNRTTDGARPSKAAAWPNRDGAPPEGSQKRKRAGDEDELEPDETPLDEPSEGDDAEEESTAEVPPVKKGKRQNRKTGGSGKKVKVFVEQKNDLLSLAASITGQAEEKSKAKLEKLKQRPAPTVKDPKQPSKAKQQQMDAARNVVAQRSKQRKDNKKADLAPPPPKVDDGKKRVSFA
ncbi:hypothetical protein JCM11491_004692 [Sporobolomyces phaffii]